jgi:flagellar biosynthesis protein FlhG
MRDQAHALRGRASAANAGAPAAPAAFVIGSGKGGVGKSALSVLLAAELARGERRVLLLDGAHNQGNLHVLLGVRPAARLDALVAGEIEVADLVVPIAERLWLLPGDSGAESLHGMAPVDRARLQRRLSSVYDEFDAVVVDAGAGIESVLRATIRASRLVVVAVPEPASLSDAYALIKIAHLQVPSLAVDVVVNRALGDGEAHTAFGRLQLAAERFLRRELRYLGAVSEDAEIARRVRTPGALLAHASTEVAAVAGSLLAPARALAPLEGTR